MTKTQITTIAQDLLKYNLNAKEGESLVVLTDTETQTIGQALFDAGVQIGLEAGLLTIIPRNQNGQEPPEYAADAMRSTDIAICPASTSFTHTQARKNAADAGARVATMPGITEEMFIKGAINADYERVKSLTDRVATALTEADEARIESSGKQIVLSIKGREGIGSDGLLLSPGSAGNLPSGEAYIAPVENSVSGTIAFDGGVVGTGEMDEPLVVTIEDGKIVESSGARPPDVLVDGPECAKMTCELGIGTNPSARIIGNTLEDEKVYGTCHVAFGDNMAFGGEIECNSHVDGIVKSPSVYLDDRLIVENGEIIL